MRVARARVVRADAAPIVRAPAGSAGARPPPGRRAPHARIRAEMRLRAEIEARAAAAARVAAHAVALAVREARADEHNLDRIVEVAVVLAERLLGEALGLAPQRVAALARQALREAGTARRVVILAHPADAALLRGTLEDLDTPEHAVAIEADPQRTRGSLRLETESGVLDAELAPQLERLALRLRESLSP